MPLNYLKRVIYFVLTPFISLCDTLTDNAASPIPEPHEDNESPNYLKPAHAKLVSNLPRSAYQSPLWPTADLPAEPVVFRRLSKEYRTTTIPVFVSTPPALGTCDDEPHGGSLDVDDDLFKGALEEHVATSDHSSTIETPAISDVGFPPLDASNILRLNFDVEDGNSAVDTPTGIESWPPFNFTFSLGAVGSGTPSVEICPLDKSGRGPEHHRYTSLNPETNHQPTFSDDCDLFSSFPPFEPSYEIAKWAYRVQADAFFAGGPSVLRVDGGVNLDHDEKDGVGWSTYGSQVGSLDSDCGSRTFERLSPGPELTLPLHNWTSYVSPIGPPGQGNSSPVCDFASSPSSSSSDSSLSDSNLAFLDLTRGTLLPVIPLSTLTVRSDRSSALSTHVASSALQRIQRNLNFDPFRDDLESFTQGRRSCKIEEHNRVSNSQLSARPCGASPSFITYRQTEILSPKPRHLIPTAKFDHLASSI